MSTIWYNKDTERFECDDLELCEYLNKVIEEVEYANYKEGYINGYKKGYHEGYQDGIKRGFQESQDDMIRQMYMLRSKIVTRGF